jgi:hypothetical protein
VSEIPPQILDRIVALPDGWAEYPASRRAATVDDPLLFAWVYLREHLHSPETGDEVTFSVVHEKWAADARRWMGAAPGPREDREAKIAPRGMGKTTWWFLILPMWAAAHGHVKFAAAFADSATQAETHLQTFRHELDTNPLLRRDFADLCAPATRSRRVRQGDRVAMSATGGTLIADNRAMLFARSGFVFAARGIDSSTLGMKVGNRRPELMIFDDVEPEEARYSAEGVRKRLATLRDGAFPLNENARVVIIGTTTMPGSIIHQLVSWHRSAGFDELPVPIEEDTRADDLAWISEERLTVDHVGPFVVHDDGTEESIWPARWPTEFLQAIRHTRSFAKNYANDPRGYGGGYWSDEDFVYGDLPGITRRLISVDPAVTTKSSSDPTGIAVVAWSPSAKKALVEHSESVRLVGADLRDHVYRLAAKFDDDGRPVGLIYVETNQGGDLWEVTVFIHPPCKVRTVFQSEKKEIRAARALGWYQRRRVQHIKRLASAEEQMISFPNAPHDDEVDAVGSGVLRLLEPPTRPKAGGRSTDY